jgi:hypothetical protein
MQEGVLTDDLELVVNPRLQQAADLIFVLADRTPGSEPAVVDAIGWLAEFGIEARELPTQEKVASSA